MIAVRTEIVVPTLNEIRRRYGDLVYGKYGFSPSVDFDVKLDFGKRVPGRGWFDTDYIAIDQGQILAMLANYRDEGVVGEDEEEGVVEEVSSCQRSTSRGGV